VTFEDAVLALRTGRLDDAELVCRGILQSVPTHDASMNVLGIIALQRGQAGLARDFVMKALACDAGNPAYHVNLAKILLVLENLDESEAHFREALRLDPDHVDAYAGLAPLLRDRKRLAEASDCFSVLVRLRPDDPDLHAIYANLLQEVGRFREAELQYREACHLKPNYPEVFNNLGNLLQASGRLGEAEIHFRHALSLKPEFPEAYNNLGNLLLECRRESEADACCREALRLRPEYALAHNNLANALLEGDDYEAAEFHYREAIRLKPGYPEAHNNLGSLFGKLCRLDEAIDFYHQAIELRPDYHEAHTNLGMTLLGVGEFEEGWQAYDAHRKVEERRDINRPRWGGEALGNRVLLIYAEQGYGDVIQFCRFVPQIASRVRVIFEVPKELVALLADLPGVEQIVARGDELPAYDVCCPLQSLPRWLGIKLEHVQGEKSYLSADPSKLQKWHDRVKALPGLRIGLAWAGNPGLANDRRRSINLDKLAPLASVSGVSFVSLQKGPTARQSLVPPAGMMIHDWTVELHDFAETAGLISALDLVIAVDTSVVHLAGALGRPVWLLNRFNSCWRWLIDSQSSPWYKTLRQFKQPKPGDWDSVIGQVKAALAVRAAGDLKLSSEEGDEGRSTSSAAQPGSHDASSLNLLGVAHLQKGRVELAIDHFSKAVELEPKNGDYRYHFGSSLKALGRFDAAEIQYREALRLKPDGAQIHGAFGTMLQDWGRLDESEPHLKEAIRLDPQSVIARNNLGILYVRKNRLEAAEETFRSALRLDPGFAEAHANLGSILWHRRELDDAEVCCRRALNLKYDLAEGHFVLAQILEFREQYEGAEWHCREALRLNPNHADWHNQLAKLLIELRKLKEARSFLDEALRLRPDHPEAHSNLAIMMLLSGDYKEGWQEYEWRWKLKKPPGRLYDFDQPAWNGQDISGQTLLIHAEQWFGDTIQFCRLIPLLKAGASVLLQVQAPLAELLKDLPGVDQIVPRGNPLPRFDVHCPLLSLPRILGLTLTNIPGHLPYLSVDPVRASKWRERLNDIAGLKVGLAWAGSSTMADDSRRSIAPDRLASLIDIPGVSFISLQKNGPERAHNWLPPSMLNDWTDELHDFSDTAALIANLDLTISVDTAVVHVAGAMGRPVWLLNRFSGCWRWLLDREDSPWYRNLRQFRQPRPGDWDSVLLRVKAALEQEALTSATVSMRRANY
jgi:Flp pilus assembly protein TadD